MFPGGSRSNEGQQAAATANANTHISNSAAQNVVIARLAQLRMQQAGTLAFNQSGQPPGNYDTFINQWQTKQDPAAYAADKWTPQQRASYVKSLGGPGTQAYTNYKNSYTAGLGAGVLPGQ